MSHQSRIGLVLLGFALLVPGASLVHAAEDAGTRSAFASGAGVRALSIGGAFGSIADDASATVWNPAGLSQLQRNELLASHATMYGLGFTEQYAFLALPSWRLGTVGISFRHLGVDGIEARDESNVLLSSDLTRSEWELGLAYGHQLGNAWSLGLTGKVRSLSFASYSGLGLGLDLGILGNPLHAFGVRSDWSRRVRLGLAVRNLLEPSITLDQESVPDPTGVRLGGSVVLPIFGPRGVLVGLDLEKTRNMDSRFHAGLELRLHTMFSLSAGYSQGTVTAGTSLSYRDLGVQYTFENNDFDTVQRIGFLLHFGSSVEQRRHAALVAEEEALRERMDREFTKRQAERVQELLKGARLAQTEERFEQGLDLLDTVDALEPDRSDVRTLRVEMEVQLGERDEYAGALVDAVVHYSRALESDPTEPSAKQGAERCHAELERRAARSAELRGEFQAAMDAFVADELVAAKAGFERILSVQPDDTDAAAMLDRTQQQIGQRVSQYLEQAEQYSRGGRFNSAEQVLDRVEQLDPQSAELASARTDLTRRRDEAQAAAERQSQAATAAAASSAVPEQPRARTDEEESEIEALYARGLAAMEQGRSQEAVGYWELVWSKDPDYQRVRSNLKQEYVLRGMQLFANRQLEDAIDAWEDALRVDPADERTMSYLNRARMQLDRAHEIQGQGR